MRRIFALLVLSILLMGQGGVSIPLFTVQEEDTDPTVVGPQRIVVSDDTLTDDGTVGGLRQVTLDTGGGGGTECSSSPCDLDASTTIGGSAIQSGAEDDTAETDAKVSDDLTHATGSIDLDNVSVTGTLESANLADGAVDLDKIADTCAASEVIRRNSSDSSWECSTVGDKLVFPGTFSGTIDPTDWVIKVEDFAYPTSGSGALAQMSTMGMATVAHNGGTPFINEFAVDGPAINVSPIATSGINFDLGDATPTETVYPFYDTIGLLRIPTSGTAPNFWDNRGLIYEIRVRLWQGFGGAWNSCFVVGWTEEPDNVTMNPATCVLDGCTSNGCFFFYIELDGDILFATTRIGGSLTTIDTGVNIPGVSSMPSTYGAATWMTLGFKALWNDAENDSDNGFVEAFVNGVSVGTITNQMPMETGGGVTDWFVKWEIINNPTLARGPGWQFDWLVTAFSRQGVDAE